MAEALVSSVRRLSGKLADAFRRTPLQESSANSFQREILVEDLEYLNRMLARIQAVIQVAEEREICDRSIQLWLTELRGVAYEAEDVLDEYHYEALRSTVEARNAAAETSLTGTKRKLEMISTCSMSSSLISIPDDMAEKIRRITKKFVEISKDRDALHLREEDGVRRFTGSQKRQPTSSLVDKMSIFGRVAEKDEVICRLASENNPSFMVVPIVGMGGLGKTTLAQLIYNDSRIPCCLTERFGYRFLRTLMLRA